MTVKGIFCDVLRTAGQDCTCNGVTAHSQCVLLVGDGVPAHFEARPDTPVVKLVRRDLGGREYMHVEPLESPQGSWNGPMAGGNFIYSTDSRFHTVSHYPLSVHDRFEKWN